MGMLELQGTRTSDADLGRVSFLNAGTRRAEIVASRIDEDNSTKMYFQTSNAGTLGTRLTIAKDGAATFNGAVTVGGNFAVQGADVDVTANIRHAGDTDTYYGFHGENLYRVVTGGAERIEVSNSGIIVNDGGADADFRVESDSNTHMLFVDGGNNNLLIGNTVVNPASGFSAIAGFGYAASGQVQIAATSNLATLVLGQNQGTNGSIVDFRKQGTIVGTISVTGSATAYNTSSDQRLKQNIQDADDAGSSIDAIQVRKFDWIDSGDHQPYGMVAQELQTVAPEAVSAPEDPDEMMGVDYSKLVPMLVKEIQTLRNRVAQLENN